MWRGSAVIRASGSRLSAFAGKIEKVGQDAQENCAGGRCRSHPCSVHGARAARRRRARDLGAGAGAITGALITGDAEGALLGAAAGAAAGAIIGHVTDRPGYCYARDQYGQTVVIECPQGY